jgi:hypothetical protein
VLIFFNTNHINKQLNLLQTMKKNFFYLSLLLGLFFGMTMFTACGGDDDDNGGSGPTTGGGGGEEGYEPGKFYGPKRVFGDNLLSSFGRENGTCYELTYNSDDFVTNIKSYRIDANGQKIYSTEYQVTYSDNQVMVTEHRQSEKNITYTYTIGNNGFVESYIDVTDGNDEVKHEYDSDGHLTRITSTETNNETWNGTLTWQNGNVIKTYDSDTGSYTQNYTSINNVAGLYIRAAIGGDLDDYYDEKLYYMGLLGKGTTNLVQSYVRDSGRTGENAWTLDNAGRPTKCVTTETGSGSSQSTSTYFWTYR